MATPENLLGLGLPPFLAKLIGNPNDLKSSQGTTIGSATSIPGGGNRHILVNASNSGTGLVMNQVGGDLNNPQLGDMVEITNILSASIIVYFPLTVKGSATTIYVDGGSVTGLTGVSVATAKPLLLRPITVSTWVGLRSA